MFSGNHEVVFASIFMYDKGRYHSLMTHTKRGPMSQELMAIGKGREGGLPALFAPDIHGAERTVEFFTAHIRNPDTGRPTRMQ